MAKILAYLDAEKPLIANVVQAAIGLVTAFGFHLTSDQAGAWMAASAALLTAVTAALTRPLQASAFTGLVTGFGRTFEFPGWPRCALCGYQRHNPGCGQAGRPLLPEVRAAPSS